MPFNLNMLFRGRKPITQQVTAGTGDLRDQYLQHIENSALAGNPALSWEEWLRRQQQAQQQQQLPSMGQ